MCVVCGWCGVCVCVCGVCVCVCVVCDYRSLYTHRQLTCLSHLACSLSVGGLLYNATCRDTQLSVTITRYCIAGYFRGIYISRISRKHSQSSKIKILKDN